MVLCVIIALIFVESVTATPSCGGAAAATLKMTNMTDLENISSQGSLTAVAVLRIIEDIQMAVRMIMPL